MPALPAPTKLSAWVDHRRPRIVADGVVSAIGLVTRAGRSLRLEAPQTGYTTTISAPRTRPPHWGPDLLLNTRPAVAWAT